MKITSSYSRPLQLLAVFTLVLVCSGNARAQLGGVLDKAGQAGAIAGEAAGVGAPTGAAVPATGGSLVDLLVQQLGVTQPQATGGAGSIFSLAKTKLSPSEFSQVAAGVPNMDSLLAAAPAPTAAADTAAGGGLAGAAMGALGGAGSLGSAAQLAQSFSSLGLGTDMVGKFIPVCVQYLQGSAGPEAASLLQGALQ